MTKETIINVMFWNDSTNNIEYETLSFNQFFDYEKGKIYPITIELLGVERALNCMCDKNNYKVDFVLQKESRDILLNPFGVKQTDNKNYTIDNWDY